MSLSRADRKAADKYARIIGDHLTIEKRFAKLHRTTRPVVLPPPALPAREPWRTLTAALIVAADHHWANHDRQWTDAGWTVTRYRRTGRTIRHPRFPRKAS